MLSVVQNKDMQASTAFTVAFAAFDMDPVARLDYEFDVLFDELEQRHPSQAFSAEEVTGAFRKQGVAVDEVEAEYVPPTADEADWSDVV